MRTAAMFVAWAAFMLAVLLWPTSVEGTGAAARLGLSVRSAPPAPSAVACWSSDDPAPSWRACAYRQRRNHVAASRVVRRLRSRPARQLQSTMGPREAICHVFGPYCSQALSVAWCESRFDVNAQNGQFLGIFQMGSHERATYGHGSTALEQAQAAYRYFVASGRDWSPWACRP